MRPIAAGRMRKRVQVQALATGEPVTVGGVTITTPVQVNDFNEPVSTWVYFVTRWAEVLPRSGIERFVAKQISPDITAGVRMRFLPGLTPRMRLVLNEPQAPGGGTTGRILNIAEAIDTEELHVEHVLLCKEQV